MNIDYFTPFSKAWTRMNQALFKPFDIAKWFVLGFTAFLADLADGPHSNGIFNYKDRFGMRELEDLPNQAWQWFTDNPGWFVFIIIGIGLIFVITIFVTWLSSRGKFMFLDNVVYNRAQVVKPWHEFRSQGNSLFLWRFIFGIACFAVFAIIALIYIFSFRRFFAEDFAIINIIGLILPILILVLIISYISLFLNNFVVPIMYKNRLSTMQAWGKFLIIFNQFPVQYIVFGIIMLFLYIFFIIVVVLTGVFTCCCGFLLVALPYIGSVVTLPIFYTFRAYSLEFFEQFGPDYKIFPEVELVPQNSSE
jgi:hypothetical protein